MGRRFQVSVREGLIKQPQWSYVNIVTSDVDVRGGGLLRSLVLGLFCFRLVCDGHGAVVAEWCFQAGTVLSIDRIRVVLSSTGPVLSPSAQHSWLS